MKIVNVVLLAAVAAATGFAVGAVVWKKPAAAAPDNQSHEIEQLETRVTLLKGERDRAREEREEAEAAAARVESEFKEMKEALLARVPEGVVGPHEPGADEPLASPGAPRFFADSHDGILRMVDWDVVGTNMEEMVRLISGLAVQLKAGEEPNAEQIGRIQQLNGPLVTAAITVAQKLPGRGVNGKFTDPSFQLNAMASTLAAAKLPLTDEQARTLEETALDWMDRDEKRRAQYDESTMELRKLCEEAKLKQGFFDDAFTQLTPGQVNALSPESSRGRIRMDIFSSGLIYIMSVKPEPVESTDQITQKFLQAASAEFSFTEAERSQAERVIQAWVNRLPRELTEWETNDLDRQGILHAARATGWGLETVKLIQEVGNTIGFDEGRWAKARRHDGIMVPLK